jgi:hypothetical protein
VVAEHEPRGEAETRLRRSWPRSQSPNPVVFIPAEAHIPKRGTIPVWVVPTPSPDVKGLLIARTGQYCREGPAARNGFVPADLENVSALAFTPRRPHPRSGAVGRTGSCLHLDNGKTVPLQKFVRNLVRVAELPGGSDVVPRTSADADDGGRHGIWSRRAILAVGRSNPHHYFAGLVLAPLNAPPD